MYPQKPLALRTPLPDASPGPLVLGIALPDVPPDRQLVQHHLKVVVVDDRLTKLAHVVLGGAGGEEISGIIRVQSSDITRLTWCLIRTLKIVIEKTASRSIQQLFAALGRSVRRHRQSLEADLQEGSSPGYIVRDRQ